MPCWLHRTAFPPQVSFIFVKNINLFSRGSSIPDPFIPAGPWPSRWPDLVTAPRACAHIPDLHHAENAVPAWFSNPALEFFILSHIVISIKVQILINGITIVIAKIEFNVHWKRWSTKKLLCFELLPEHCDLELGNNPFQPLFTSFVCIILMVNFGLKLWSRCSVVDIGVIF